MGVIEQIQQMKAQGIDDSQIIQNLQSQGYSPKQISDAISQAQVKNAISNEQNYSQAPSPSGNQDYSQTQDDYSNPSSNQTQDYQYSQQPQYDNAGYAQQSYSSSGTDTIIEVAEQVFNEKMKKIQNQVENFSEFQTLTQSKIENISERLRKIESTIDQLQTAILQKVGSYGGTLEGIKKEMSMMQDSFGKVVNQAVKNSKKTKKK